MVGDQDTGSPGRPVSSGLQVPVEPGIVAQEQDPLGDLPAAFFLQNILQLNQQRWIILCSWIWSIISGVVTILGRPGRGASQVEKSPRLNWTTQFLTVAYDGACSPNVFYQNGVNFLRRLALQEKNLTTARGLRVVEIARVAWHASFQPL